MSVLVESQYKRVKEGWYPHVGVPWLAGGNLALVYDINWAQHFMFVTHQISEVQEMYFQQF